jgi:hypothetical protein
MLFVFVASLQVVEMALGVDESTLRGIRSALRVIVKVNIECEFALRRIAAVLRLSVEALRVIEPRLRDIAAALRVFEPVLLPIVSLDRAIA